ncbi:hypothetical protein PCC7418_0808 [Halothece sp. PCC 7418]|uniref:hypothetical protein n=1 Tax=Halothece sp. (strain PCC 7418) TaxID=65093 RepID=UPI0002A08959|nr:hypothetical protein [Halothece sp. PCC 7418]AFZ43023.1 hypothetical protein PCC7418_0808 [Halothece sp. PCC 7418]
MPQVMIFNHSERLRDQVTSFSVDSANSIPWIVRLLENSQSPLALPGHISLFNHDCLHILLGRDRAPESEAYVIGFTMGNDINCRRIHLWIFKIFALLIYPEKYRLRWSDREEFDRGVADGRQLEVKNLNQIDFSHLQDYSVRELRQQFALSSSVK